MSEPRSAENVRLETAEKYLTRALAAEEQVRDVRRVIEALRGANGSVHGPVIDEVRRSTADWLDAALDGRLDPEDARRAYTPKRATPPGGCPTPGCPGDTRYSAPGRRHAAGCTHPIPPAPDPGESHV